MKVRRENSAAFVFMFLQMAATGQVRILQRQVLLLPVQGTMTVVR